ncbi:MFS transporter [Escherichia coli]
MEPASPFFPIGYMTSTISAKVIRVLFFHYFSVLAILQPLFGLLSDKLGLRKYLLWIIHMLVMFAPFLFIFGPLLQYNILVGIDCWWYLSRLLF